MSKKLTKIVAKYTLYMFYHSKNCFFFIEIRIFTI